eukprot:m.125138 g.125138  ORF g.125138 m.125138 type:complete len:162 (+) comp17316_c0_seq3:108-593(+)
MALSCVAVIGQQNNPLFFKTAVSDPTLALQHAVFSSLDVIEEKVLANGKSPTADRDMFLGLLFPSDEHRLYGYVTSTNIKFVLVVGDPNIADRKIRELFKTLHDFYIKLVCNPFYTAGAAIESRRFDEAVTSLMASTTQTTSAPSSAVISNASTAQQQTNF